MDLQRELDNQDDSQPPLKRRRSNSTDSSTEDDEEVKSQRMVDEPFETLVNETKLTFVMSAITSDCDSLSVRQRKLNVAVNEAYRNKLTLDAVVSSDDQTDIDTICKIDLASRYRNVDYIIDNLKSTDSLCVARALQANWLFTYNDYSHIINPTYVNTTLQPLMSDKAFSKFMSRLACNVKDEKRCEEFYLHFVQMKNERYMKKFLWKCSIPFIKSKILMKDFDITPHYLTLLSLKSQDIIDAYIESELHMTHEHIYALKHLMDTHGDFYLDLLEKYILKHGHRNYRFGQRVTREIIRNHKERIFKLPYTYLQLLHFKQLVYALTQDEVKHLAFLIAEHEDVWRNDVLKSLINLLPKEEQFEFSKSIFEKFFPSEDFEMNLNFVTYSWYEYMSEKQREEWALKYIAQRNEYHGEFYQWYKFVDFSKTFIEIKKLLRVEPDASERESMFEILVSTCDDDESNITKLLNYFHDRHINEIILLKQHIIERIMDNKCIYKCGNEVWDVLNEILLSLKIYETENDCYDGFKKCAITHVMAHQIIYDKPITMKMFKLYEKYYSKLSIVTTTPWKEKVFNFLYKWLVTRINDQNLQNSNCLDVAIKWINELILLIEYYQYPVNAEVISFVRKIRGYNSNALSDVICQEKFKEFFQDEQPLPDEHICLQKLKKDVASLDSYKAKFDAKIQSNTMRYRRFLSKIRIYFGRDLALKWRKYYLDKLKASSEDSTGCASVLFGLSILLPAAQYEELIKQYQVENAKLVCETDPCLVHIQSNIAKYMHLIRPVVNCELLLSFAKGDFLQYTVNSMLSVSRQLTQDKSREVIVKLLASPVSVQKHGVRMAFKKFNTEELIDIFGKMWTKTENVSIRQLLFSSIHDMLIATEDDTKCLAIWKLLRVMITQLHENKFVTNIVNPSTRGLHNVRLSVRPLYCTAYWHLLQSAQECDEIWSYRNTILEAMTDNSLLNLLDEGFVKSIIFKFLQSYFDEGIWNKCPHWYLRTIWPLIAKFVVRCETKVIAERRKEDVLAKATQNAISQWNFNFDANSTPEIFRNFVRYLAMNCKEVLYIEKHSFYNPVHVVEYIWEEIVTKLTEFEHYQYRLWVKFNVILVKSFSECRTQEIKVDSDRDHLLAEIFGKHCVELMRSEVAANYPHLPQLFGDYLKKFFYYDIDYDNKDAFYIGVSKVFLKEKNDINNLYIVVELLMSISDYSDVKVKADEMLNAIKEINVSDVNHYIHSKKSDWTPFGH